MQSIRQQKKKNQKEVLGRLKFSGKRHIWVTLGKNGYTRYFGPIRYLLMSNKCKKIKLEENYSFYHQLAYLIYNLGFIQHILLFNLIYLYRYIMYIGTVNVLLQDINI